MTAARVDMVIDQGADFVAQIYWLDQDNYPIRVVDPIRMEVRSVDANQLVHAFQSGGPGESENEVYNILYNTDNGIIQITMSAADTSIMSSGKYRYDLFTGYEDQATDKVYKHRLIQGIIEVRGRVTQNG